MREITMPSLGADMEEGRVVEWLVHPGDHVRRGDLVAVVDTDKADIEIESFADGTVDAFLVELGVTVPVGTPIARLDGTAAPVAAAPVAAAPVASPRAVEPPAGGAALPPPTGRATPPGGLPAPARLPGTPPTGHGGDHVPSPLVRRLARHLGVDLDAVTGTGDAGRITRADVEAAAAARTAAPPPVTARPTPPAVTAAVEPTRDRDATMRRAIAALMTRSAREVPQYHLRHRIDLRTASAWLADVNAGRVPRDRLVPAALLMKATARAAAATPALNGWWRDDGFEPACGVRLGVAVSLRRGGLLVPAIADADRLDLDALMVALRDLVERARAGRLRASELADPSITVTNLGDTGVDVVHGLVYPPQVALVGFGRIHPEAWAADGMVGERPVVHATLAGDHRASDGIGGARLLAAIERLLQHPDDLRGGNDGT